VSKALIYKDPGIKNFEPPQNGKEELRPTPPVVAGSSSLPRAR
jgi:hypothetical protein